MGSNFKHIALMAMVSVAFLTISINSFSQGLRTVNTAQFIGNGRFKWSIYLLSTKQVMDEIKFVDYYLHPTFTDPIVRVDNRSPNFKLQSNGWGEFNIHIKVHFTNGSLLELDHWLKLKDGEQSVQNEGSTNGYTDDRIIRTGNTSVRAGSSWKWTVFVYGSASVMNSINCVTYTLHPTFSNPVQRTCTKGNDENMCFPLSARGWGTFRISIIVNFTDGRTKELFHDLVFR